jgi:rhodanese-related sulfurtransferase
MGWHLAGFTCASGKTDRAPAVTREGLAWAKPAAERVAGKFGVARTDRATVERWRQDKGRTTYVFDVRDPSDYVAGHYPGALPAPGGQLVQATDIYAGTLGARIVVCDDAEVRALMTASWLRQMSWTDVFVLAEAGNETGMPAPVLLGTPANDRAIEPAALEAMSGATVIDLSASPRYRRGHIPGAWFAIRSRLDRAMSKIAPAGPVVLTCEDGTLASLAAADAQALTGQPVHWLKGGNAAWNAAGLPLSAAERMADEPVDVWLKPYERATGHEAAMNAYLSWEVDLLDRIKRDGTTHFLHGQP